MKKVIIKTKKPDYIPSYITVRAQISETILTADIEEDNIHLLEEDNNIEGITINKKLQCEEQK